MGLIHAEMKKDPIPRLLPYTQNSHEKLAFI